MTNLATNLKDVAGQFPDRLSIRMGDLSITYAELDDLASRVAGWLDRQGVAPGDRVAIMLPNVAAFPVIYYGVLRIGATVVPMNPLLKAPEINHYLRDSGAKLIFAWEGAISEAAVSAATVGANLYSVGTGMLDELRAWAPHPDVAARQDDDTAVILYTSGTTGTPKGAQLTHGNMRANASVVALQLGKFTPDDVIMGCLPLFHSFGQTCGLNAAVIAGATLSLLPRFDPAEAMRLIERDGVTVLEGVPTMYIGLIQAAGESDTSSLRLCISGGAALPGEVHEKFETTFDVSIMEGYGLSETSPVASFNVPGRSKVGSIGVPIDGVEMRVVGDDGTPVQPGEVGEIAIRGHNVMQGYWHRPEATADAIRDGWFHTGDMGRQDEDGFFFIVDRKKDMIIRGGYNVYPREIEEVFYTHPDVVEAAVIGVPHPQLGEEVAAAVALRPDATVTPDDLREFVKARVAAYKYPRIVWQVPSLPKGPTGKVLKRNIEVPVSAQEVGVTVR